MKISTVLAVLILFPKVLYPEIPKNRPIFFDCTKSIIPEFIVTYYNDKSFITHFGATVPMSSYSSLFMSHDLASTNQSEAIMHGDINFEYKRLLLSSEHRFFIAMSTGVFIPVEADDTSYPHYQKGFNDHIYFTLQAMYLFRRNSINFGLRHNFISSEESLYESLEHDLSDFKTYKSFFGLNPFFSTAFLSPEKLSDDYLNLFLIISFYKAKSDTFLFHSDFMICYPGFQKKSEPLLMPSFALEYKKSFFESRDIIGSFKIGAVCDCHNAKCPSIFCEIAIKCAF